MRIHYLQHMPFEKPAAIAEWAISHGHEITGSHVYRGDPLPSTDDFDWLVVMGGPMGVSDIDEYQWMRPELDLIGKSVACGRRVLGVCLGAQFLAHALGARVYPAPEKEIGWLPVEGLPVQTPGVYAGLPAHFVPLHWHGDTFDLPGDAVHLARGPACANQAFQFGDRAIGLQFHIEATPDSVAEMSDHCADDIEGGRWQMSESAIRDCSERCATMRPILDDLLDFMAR
ncbi:MAG: type 1 glutamine amidotransferase [Ectothiorhodospiraceae bacterium]